MLRFLVTAWRHALFAILFLVVASCSGGGCSSGCAGCGTTPLPGGFPKTSTIANAASVRLTRSGLDFLGDNIPKLSSNLIKTNGGVVTFEIPKSDTSTTVLFIPYNIHICPNGPKPTANPPECLAEIKIGGAKLHVDAVTPHSIKVSGTVPVRLKDLPINASVIGDFSVGLGTGGCTGDKPDFDYKDFPIHVELPLIAETIAPRQGYTKVDVKNAVVDVDIQQGDVSLCVNCGIASVICDGVLNFVKDLAFTALIGGVKDQLKSALEDQLCTSPVAMANPPCPAGSMPNMANDKCVYTLQPDTCVPTNLGTDGHIDLSGLLKSISPGTSGGLDFGLSAGGDMDPQPGSPPDDMPYPGHTPNGVTLGMLGGTIPQPQSGCVPMFMNPPPDGIPIPDEMKADKLMPWPASDPKGPHLGIALAGRFLNHSLGSIYNSGLLCLGITTDQFAQLNSGLLSVLIPSIKKLTFEQRGAPVAIVTRPQAPPTLKLGAGVDIKKDPLITVLLDKFAVDFYIWSYDRFVRGFTLTADISVPLNLQTAKDPKKNPAGGILPVLGDLGIKNAVVSNNDILTDDPATMANALSSILGGFAGQFLGSGFSPIDVSSSLASVGLNLTIPDGGIRKLHKDRDDFLAIFADLTAVPATNARLEADTGAQLLGKTVHAEAMGLLTADKAKLPSLHVAFSSSLDDGTRAIEYSWRLDSSTPSAWSREKDITIQNDYLFFQGKHTLYASARVVGQPETEDSTPAALPYVVDTLAPFVELKRVLGASSTLRVKAWDIVSDESALRARFRTTDALGEHSAWSPWGSLEAVKTIATPGAESVDVEVGDEEGNIAGVSALVRGRDDATLAAAGGGCGCSTPGRSHADRGLELGSILALGGALLLLVLRRRGGRVTASILGLGSICAVASTSQGCACGSEDGAQTTGCGSDCNQACQPALPMGLVGAYTSVAKAKSGVIWVAGYNDAVLSSGNNFLYGDLVVGKYDSGKHQVQWETVDGLPPKRADNTCPDSDPRGWRGGESDAGDDVGLWTSVKLDAGDHPMVSYYDATHTALKFASYDGEKWAVHAVAQTAGSDMGRYSKLIVKDGKPVIAFLTLEPGNGGKTRTKVTLAKGQSVNPHAPEDWVLEDAALDENSPCRSSTCAADTVCVKDTGVCSPKASGCTPADCGMNSACVTLAGKATCSDIVADATTDSYPNAYGDYINLADGPDGLAILLYDRIHGNLVGVANPGGGWKAIIFDGETGSRANKTAIDTGDVGVGASLFIAPNNDWHVSYVNGITETLEYVVAPGGTKPGKPEHVDDGSHLDGKAFPDGKHVVGDDSFIEVDDSGTVTISYQDATLGQLRVATGTLTQGAHKWSSKAIPQPDRFAGFFSQPVPGDSQIANWWRSVDPDTKDITGDVSFVER